MRDQWTRCLNSYSQVLYDNIFKLTYIKSFSKNHPDYKAAITFVNQCQAIALRVKNQAYSILVGDSLERRLYLFKFLLSICACLKQSIPIDNLLAAKLRKIKEILEEVFENNENWFFYR